MIDSIIRRLYGIHISSFAYVSILSTGKNNYDIEKNHEHIV